MHYPCCRSLSCAKLVFLRSLLRMGSLLSCVSKLLAQAVVIPRLVHLGARLFPSRMRAGGRNLSAAVCRSVASAVVVVLYPAGRARRALGIGVY